MIRTNSFLYIFLDYFYKYTKATLHPQIPEVRYFLTPDDISSLSLKGLEFKVLLSKSGIERITSSLNINSVSRVVLLFKNENNKLIRLTKAPSLKDLLYVGTLIWNAKNDEDKHLQICALKNFIE